MVRPLGRKSLISAIAEPPTVSETGLPGFEVVPWGGMIVPAGVSKAIASPAFGEKMLVIGYDPVGGT